MVLKQSQKSAHAELAKARRRAKAKSGFKVFTKKDKGFLGVLGVLRE
jgi:hypothetical protein